VQELPASCSWWDVAGTSGGEAALARLVPASVLASYAAWPFVGLGGQAAGRMPLLATRAIHAFAQVGGWAWRGGLGGE
jgi:hypothetical protein